MGQAMSNQKPRRQQVSTFRDKCGNNTLALHSPSKMLTIRFLNELSWLATSGQIFLNCLSFLQVLGPQKKLLDHRSKILGNLLEHDPPRTSS